MNKWTSSGQDRDLRRLLLVLDAGNLQKAQLIVKTKYFNTCLDIHALQIFVVEFMQFLFLGVMLFLFLVHASSSCCDSSVLEELLHPEEADVSKASDIHVSAVLQVIDTFYVVALKKPSCLF